MRRNLLPRYTLLTLGYALLVQLAFLLALALRFDAVVLDREWGAWASLAPALTALSLLGFLIAGLYHGLWRFAGTVTFFQVFKGVTLSALALTGLLLARPDSPFSIGFVVLFWVCELALMGSARLGWRLWREGALDAPAAGPGRERTTERAIVAGAGPGGVSLVQQMRRGASGRRAFIPIGFLDEDPRLRGKHIEGVPVLGALADLPRLVAGRIADVVVLSDPDRPAAEVREIARVCEPAGVRVKTLPGLADPARLASALARVRDVDIEDLLGRRAVQLDVAAIRGSLRGQRVLVTGAGGSIGGELARQVMAFSPAAVGLLDRAENGLYFVHRELAGGKPTPAVEAIVADVQDAPGLEEVFRRFKPTVVFHAAAHKHVPLLELHPREAVLNNIVGTRNVLDAAEKQGVARLVLISTDKAVKPSSIMGASKRVCEMLFQARARHGKTKLVAVRFGNVLGSEGSVIPLFRRQIERGGPVTVTHPDARRYFMTIGEAARLVLQAAAMGQGGELFLLDMGEQVRIVDLARQLVRLAGLREGQDIEIVFTGLRPGEKLFEELHTASEHARMTRHERVLMWDAEPVDEGRVASEVRALETAARRGDDAAIRAHLHRLVADYREVQGPEERGRERGVVELPASPSAAATEPRVPAAEVAPAPSDHAPRGALERRALPDLAPRGAPPRPGAPAAPDAPPDHARALGRRDSDGAGPGARRERGQTRLTSDGLLAAAMLALSSPLWALVWLEARRAGRRDWLEERVCVGRSRRSGGPRMRRALVGTERRNADRRTVDLLGAPLACARFRPDLGPVSRWLARRGLDRLPMLRNVVRGEMALVGPGPVSQGLVGRWTDLVPGIERRFEVPPGVTGLAQLSGDAEDDTGSLVRRAALDLEYVARRSPGLDLAILFRTLGFILAPPRPRPVPVAPAPDHASRGAARRATEPRPASGTRSTRAAAGRRAAAPRSPWPRA